jgi:hypothetical protein
MKAYFWFCLLLGMCATQAAEIKEISLPLIPDIQRADIYVLKMTQHPSGLLVLCPGCNGNGENWLESPIWQKYALTHNLDLIGLSFASDVSLLKSGRGYYYAKQGSGQLLLDGIEQEYSGLPLLLYGFSGGAHFTSGFVEWKPDRVIGWCAYSAGWWDSPTRNAICPPGLIACGENDQRLGASLNYFKQGRALGKPWLWLSVPKTGHSNNLAAENFVRDYFTAILTRNGTANSGEWVDIDRKIEISDSVAIGEPTLAGWLPDSKLLPTLREVYQP